MYTHTKKHHHDEVSKPTLIRPRNITAAVVLNCLLPGLGLAYLGHWGLAAVNFVIVQVVVIGCFFFNEPAIMEHIHWVFLVLIVGSGSFAHGLAKNDAASQ